MKKIWVVIVTFNGGKQILQCVGSIFKLPIAIYELKTIIVDNASTDGSLEKLKAQGSKLKNLILIENKENLGFAGGANRGIKRAIKEGAEYVVLLNQDAIVKRDTVEKLVNVIKKDKKISICGPLILTMEKSIWSAGGVIDKKRYSGGHLFKIFKKRPYEVDFISGCAMMIKREVFEKIDFLDERFFLYYEDVDLCFRAKRTGFKVVFVPKAVVYHQVSNGEKEKVRQYYMAKNHLLFLEKHAPLKIKIREAARLPKTIYEHLKRGENFALLGIKDYLLRS